MSKAYKCDKCGDLVKEAKSCNGHEHYQDRTVINLSYSRHGAPIDLCVHCEVKIAEDTLEYLKGCLPIMPEEDLISSCEVSNTYNENGGAYYDGSDEDHDNDDPDDMELCK